MSLADTLADIHARADWAALPQALPFTRMPVSYTHLTLPTILRV